MIGEESWKALGSSDLPRERAPMQSKMEMGGDLEGEEKYCSRETLQGRDAACQRRAAIHLGSSPGSAFCSHT